jgi:hypothetical protein
MFQSHKNFARDTELPPFPLGPGSVRFLPPKENIDAYGWNVRFVPIADMAPVAIPPI